MRSFDSPPPVLAERSICQDSPESYPIQADAASCDPGPELIYDLRAGRASSDCFYADVSALSSPTVTEIDRQAASALDGYSQYVAHTLREVPRTRGEYALELLTLGMALIPTAVNEERLVQIVSGRQP